MCFDRNVGQPIKCRCHVTAARNSLVARIYIDCTATAIFAMAMAIDEAIQGDREAIGYAELRPKQEVAA